MKSPPKGKHMAGIIPIAGKDDILGMPWPDCLQPLSPNSTPIERSLHECLIAGCDSVWVVCNDNSAPIIKKRMGDYALNPEIYEKWHYLRKKEDHKRYVPIFYVPGDQKDRDRRDSLGWSVLHGSLTAFRVSSNISKWLSPSKYFVSFPYGIYDPTRLRRSKSKIRSTSSFYSSYGGKTVRDGLYLSFTFNPDDWIHYRRTIKKMCSGASPELPLKERWSSKDFTLDKIFNHAKIGVDYILDIEEYYCFDSWESLRGFYKSDLDIRKPPKSIIKPYYR